MQEVAYLELDQLTRQLGDRTTVERQALYSTTYASDHGVTDWGGVGAGQD